MPFAGVGGTSVRAEQYLIDNSLRFNDDDSAHLGRTFSAGNRRTFTFSFWFKRGNLGSIQHFFSNQNDLFAIQSGDYIFFDFNGAAAGTFAFANTLLRDPSAWYHIVLAIDTTDATGADRLKLYINGERITPSSSTPPSQDYQTNIDAAQVQVIGKRQSNGDRFLDGYLAEFVFIDGTALTPTSFGETDVASGIWKPIDVSGLDYSGVNSFYLDFENSGSLGADVSGNGNNWTPSGIASTDQMLDSSTNNFPTVNPLQKDSTTYLSEGNLKFQISQSDLTQEGTGTMGASSGKFYWETACIAYTTSPTWMIGIKNILGPHTADWTSSYVYCYYGANGQKYNAGSGTSYGSTYTTGDIIGIALDLDAGTLTFYKNNISQGTAFTGLSGTFIPFYGTGLRPVTTTSNFGQDSSFAGNKTRQNNTDANGYGDFYYTPPTGYFALCTQNLATISPPTIDDGSLYQNQVLYTGDGTSPRSITGLGFQPDWLWFKSRNSTDAHFLYDTNRGVYLALRSNATNAESSNTEGVQSFDSDGWTMGNFPQGNFNGNNYVTWGWKANGGTTSSNTDGSITSTVQTNGGGFSIVTFTGTGANGTFGHGLGAVPKFIIFKNRTDVSHWICYHEALGNTTGVYLNLTNANSGTSSAFWNNTTPTSSVVSVGVMNEGNGSGDNIVAYCFAEIEGYSKMGSYIGNGSDDGTFIYTGFRPSFVMMKKTSGTGNWNIFDSTRDIDNVGHHLLFANLSNAEETTTSNRDIDFVSNGFKQREGANQDTNGSGGTYIYIAFAENPFVSSGAVPVVAR